MFLFFTHQCVFFNKFIINKNIFLFIKMNKILIYIFITILLIVCITNLKSISKSNEKYDNERPPGPWGNIGTGKPWYDYPYILHNIEYFKK
jgi:hypothetical protein